MICEPGWWNGDNRWGRGQGSSLNGPNEGGSLIRRPECEQMREHVVLHFLANCWQQLVLLTVQPGKPGNAAIKRKLYETVAHTQLSFSLRGWGEPTAAGSLSLPLETRDRVEVAAPIDLALGLPASLHALLKMKPIERSIGSHWRSAHLSQDSARFSPHLSRVLYFYLCQNVTNSFSDGTLLRDESTYHLVILGTQPRSSW